MKKFTIKTLGCKTNQIESAIIEEKLLSAGYILATNINDTDIFILNSCSVTNTADNKSLHEIHCVKKQNKNITTVLTGCFAQLEYKKLLKDPLIDIIVGNQEKTDIVNILNSTQDVIFTDIFEHKEFKYEKLNNLRRTRATIKIQDGCNNRCSYCTIPFARGVNRSNSIDNIIEQINILSTNDFKEVVFTGIHIGQWGQDFQNNLSLLNLLEEVEKTNIQRYRLGSLNPLELNNELIDFLSNSKKFCPHFHLSLQSACDKTLKNMNRHYSYELAYDITNEINKKFDLPFLGSDIIVGFPGETEEDFETTYKNLQKTELSQIHVFPYSMRKNTIAAGMDNHVPSNIKKERAKIIQQLSNQKLTNFLKSNISNTQEIIVEKSKDKKTNLYKGLTKNYINVLFEEQKEANSIQKIKLTSFSEDNKKLIGKIVS